MSELSEKFKKHFEDEKIQKALAIESFKKEFPDDPLPESLKDDFSLPFALHSMCKEIKKLMDELTVLSELVL